MGMNKSGEISCYGDDKGCLWGGPHCSTDQDCASKYSVDSKHYTDKHTCGSLKSKGVEKDYWGQVVCA